MESRWIDIGAELVHAASEGLFLIEWLSSWVQLDDVSSVLRGFTTLPLDIHEYPQGDALEYCAAVALRHVDTLVEQQRVLAQRWNPRAQAPTLLPPTGHDGAEGIAAALAGCGAAGMRKIHGPDGDLGGARNSG